MSDGRDDRRDDLAAPDQWSERQGDDLVELPPEAEAKIRALQADLAARQREEARQRRARRDLWLSHHWLDEYDRCAVVGGRHVCRRCLTLYPIALAVMALSFVGAAPWPGSADPVLIWALCIPATLEFLAEKLWSVAYSPRRQIAVTALVGLALGRGLAHEVDDRWSWLFWGPVLVFGTVWFVAAALSAQRSMMKRALAGSIEYGEASEGG